jgi:nucleoside-diphosphate-sugar epimerase
MQADIRDADSWAEIAKWADVIFHLAGNTSANAAASDPAESLRSTVLPVAHLITAAEAYGRKPRVVFASTATVYGLTPKTPVDENYPTNPVTIYDMHKLFAEQQLAMASQQVKTIECIWA